VRLFFAFYVWCSLFFHCFVFDRYFILGYENLFWVDDEQTGKILARVAGNAVENIPKEIASEATSMLMNT
jgi:hypothetical protein